MHRFLPQTDDEIKEMLKVIGVSSIEDLFADIPASLRAPEDVLGGLKAQSEIELRRRYHKTASRVEGTLPSETKKLSGAGAYRHYIPAAVDALAGRSEFVTCYTPYQPEVSQGTLTAIFQYQSYLCDLTGHDVANASMYDGASALAEAVLMAVGQTRRSKVVLAGTVWPRWRAVVETYVQARGIELVIASHTDGLASSQDYTALIDDKTAAVVLQTPNTLGLLETDLKEIFTAATEKGAIGIQVFNPIAQAILATPAENGASIAVAEGQPLGLPVSAGGPYLGILTAASPLVRRMPGRIAGETMDSRGQRCFVLTLQTREQHIRRDKATSNICSNQALMAMRAVIFLSLMGKEGLRQMADFNLRAGRYALSLAQKSDGIELPFDGEIFNEFVFRVLPGGEARYKELLAASHEVVGMEGVPKGLRAAAFTELSRKEDIDALFQ